MAWGAPDLQNLWWFKPEPPPEFLPGIIAGAQNAHQQRMDRIIAADEMYKQQVREQMGAGTVELSKALAEGFRSGDVSSDESQARFAEVAQRYPYLVGTSAWNGIETMIRNGEQIKLRRAQQESLNQYRTSMAESAATRAEAALSRATSYGLSVEDQAEYRRNQQELRNIIASGQIDVQQARVDYLKAQTEGFERRLSVAEQNVEMRKAELDQRRLEFSDKITPLDKARLNAADLKFKNFAYSSKAAENLKAYEAEQEAILKPYREKAKEKATPKKVRVLDPSGKPGYIPEDQLDAALKQGYQRAP